MSLFRARPPVERRDFTSSASVPSNVEIGGWRNTSGHHVNTDSALRISAVYGCVGLIADSLSTMPVDVFRKRSDGTREELELPPLLTFPSGDLLPVEWKFSVFSSLLLRGNAYGIKDNFDRLGYPQAIHLVHPDEVSVTRDSDGATVYRYGGDTIPLRRVFHLKGFTMPGALEGVSPVWQFAQTLGMSLAAEDFGARFYGDGAHPTAVLETDQPVNRDQADIIKARVMATLRGRREPVILGAGTKWKPIQVSPNEAMFLDSMRFGAVEIARIYHVPPSMIGAQVEGTSLTYSNREQDEIMLQTRALLPWAVRLEQAFARMLPGRQFLKFNMDAAVRVDLTTRYAAHALGIKAGFLLRDEARALEDRPPLTDDQRDEAIAADIAYRPGGNPSV